MGKKRDFFNLVFKEVLMFSWLDWTFYFRRNYIDKIESSFPE